MQIMVLKPSLDTRDGEGVIKSRAGLERKCIMVDHDVNLYKVVKAYKNVLASQLETLKWVIIDECQFLTEAQIDQLSDVVDFLDVNVMCYGLRTDFQTHLFEGSRRLFEIADTIDEIKSTCNCGRKTIVNARIDANGDFVDEGQQVEIGGNDRYVAVCRKCWRNKHIEQSERGALPLDFPTDNLIDSQ